MKNLVNEITFLAILIISTFVNSKEVQYDLNISYFDGAPDGVPKSILGVNNQFPGPTIRAEIYDTLTIKVTNSIQDGQTTTVHWHGLEQFLSPWQDGPRMLTQCDIPQNASYVYKFQVIQSGNYWYHAHHTSQYSEGLWGLIIIDNLPEVHAYDGEFALVLSDWFHPTAKDITTWYENTTLSRGGMPYPDSALINGAGYYPCEYSEMKNVSCDPTLAQTYKMFLVERGKTYRFRVLNPATTVLYFLSIDGHKLETIETDGVDTERVEGVDRVTVSTGTRYSFLVKMDGDLDQYWIRSFAGLNVYKLDYPNINPYPEAHIDTVLAVLRYIDGPVNKDNVSKPKINIGAKQGRPETHDINKSLPIGKVEVVNGFVYYQNDPVITPIANPPFPTTNAKENPVTLNYMDCKPFGDSIAPNYVNQSIILYVPDIDHPNNTFKLGFNNVSYDASSLDKPALVKILYDEELPASLNTIEINGFGSDYVVELIINDYGDSGHPFHLHGHTFWVMGYGSANDGPFIDFRDRPKLRSGVRRETMAIQYNSWLVIRFRADNPGIWLFHCHMNFHFEAALGLVIVSGREVAKELFKEHLPQEMKDLCALSGIGWE